MIIPTQTPSSNSLVLALDPAPLCGRKRPGQKQGSETAANFDEKRRKPKADSKSKSSSKVQDLSFSPSSPSVADMKYLMSSQGEVYHAYPQKVATYRNTLVEYSGEMEPMLGQMSGNCLFSAVSKLIKPTQEHTILGEDAEHCHNPREESRVQEFSLAYQLAGDASVHSSSLSKSGHEFTTVMSLAKIMGLNWIHAADFKILLNSCDLKRVQWQGKSLSPALLLYPSHVSILIDPTQKLKYLTYANLSEAFQTLRDHPEDDNINEAKWAVSHPTPKNPKTAKKKQPANKALKEESSNSRVEHRGKHVETKMTEKDAIHRSIRLVANQVKDLDTDKLPDFHEHDVQFSHLYVFLKEGVDHKDRKLRFLPIPHSKYQLAIYYCLAKKHSPMHEPEPSQIWIQPYKLLGAPSKYTEWSGPSNAVPTKHLVGQSIRRAQELHDQRSKIFEKTVSNKWNSLLEDKAELQEQNSQLPRQGLLDNIENFIPGTYSDKKIVLSELRKFSDEQLSQMVKDHGQFLAYMSKHHPNFSDATKIKCGILFSQQSNFQFRDISPTVSFSPEVVMAIHTEAPVSYEPREQKGKYAVRMDIKVNVEQSNFSIQMYTQTQDTITKTMAGVLHSMYSKEETKHLNVQCGSKGGHNFGNMVRNFDQNRCMTQWFHQILQDMLKGKASLSQHIGSKFKKVQGLIHEMFMKFFQSIAYSLGLERSAIKRDDGGVQPAITLYTTWLRENRGTKLTARDFQVFFISSFGEDRVPQMLQGEDWIFPVIAHIRPNNDQYDKIYWRNNIDSTLAAIASSQLDIKTTLFQGTVQEFTVMWRRIRLVHQFPGAPVVCGRDSQKGKKATQQKQQKRPQSNDMSKKKKVSFAEGTKTTCTHKGGSSKKIGTRAAVKAQAQAQAYAVKTALTTRKWHFEEIERNLKFAFPKFRENPEGHTDMIRNEFRLVLDDTLNLPFDKTIDILQEIKGKLLIECLRDFNKFVQAIIKGCATNKVVISLPPSNKNNTLKGGDAQPKPETDQKDDESKPKDDDLLRRPLFTQSQEPKPDDEPMADEERTDRGGDSDEEDENVSDQQPRLRSMQAPLMQSQDADSDDGFDTSNNNASNQAPRLGQIRIPIISQDADSDDNFETSNNQNQNKENAKQVPRLNLSQANSSAQKEANQNPLTLIDTGSPLQNKQDDPEKPRLFDFLKEQNDDQSDQEKPDKPPAAKDSPPPEDSNEEVLLPKRPRPEPKDARDRVIDSLRRLYFPLIVGGWTPNLEDSDTLTRLFSAPHGMYHIMMDSHYYLQPSNAQERNVMFHNVPGHTYMFVQGKEFHTVPGSYKLPFNEGEFTVTTEQKLMMHVRGNGAAYVHDNGQFADLSGGMMFDFGWFRTVVIQQPYESYLFRHAVQIPMQGFPKCSIQAQWMTKRFDMNGRGSKVVATSNALQEWQKRDTNPQGYTDLRNRMNRIFGREQTIRSQRSVNGKIVERLVPAEEAFKSCLMAGMWMDIENPEKTYFRTTKYFIWSERQYVTVNHLKTFDYNTQWFGNWWTQETMPVPLDPRIVCGRDKKGDQEEEKKSDKKEEKKDQDLHHRLAAASVDPNSYPLSIDFEKVPLEGDEPIVPYRSLIRDTELPGDLVQVTDEQRTFKEAQEPVLTNEGVLTYTLVPKHIDAEARASDLLTPKEMIANAIGDLHYTKVSNKKAKSDQLPENLTTRPSSVYYREKKPDPASMEINDLLQHPDWKVSNNESLEAIKEYCTSGPISTGPKMEYKGQIVPVKDVTSNQVSTLAGSEALIRGKSIHEFEWGSKSCNNLIWAFCMRQLGAQQRYDREKLHKFYIFIKPWIKARADIFNAKYDPEQNLLHYCDKQTQWPKNKKDNYAANINLAFRDPTYNDYNGSFICMCKSGEVNHTTEELIEDDEGFTKDQETRPRCICVPEGKGYGMLQAIQGTFWTALKETFPEFIHSMPKSHFKDHIRKRIRSNWKSISIDGSSWDSSQFPELQLIESLFLKLIKPSVRELIRFNKDQIAPDSEVSADQVLENVMRAFSETLNHIFLRIPQVNGPDWKPEVMKRFISTKQPKGKRPEDDWVHFAINGTTFSGQSFRTTLGNTLRSICYAYFYIHCTNLPQFKQPWASEHLFVVASGDDTVMWCSPQYAEAIKNSILNLTTRNRKPQEVGLGQCVKAVNLDEWFNFDFCSLWTYSLSGSIDDLVLTPDYFKLFTQKQYYQKRNAEIHRNPLFYLSAKLLQVQQAQASRIMESMIQAQVVAMEERAQCQLTPEQVQNAYKCFNLDVKQFDSEEYKGEDFINHKLNISLFDVLTIMKHNQVNVLCGKDEEVRVLCGSNDVSKIVCTQNHRILVTTNFDHVVEAIRAIDSSRYFVDNEKSLSHKTVNAMSLVSATSELGILYHGPNVHLYERQLYELLETMDTICYSWGNNLERGYPNLCDMQRLYFEQTGGQRELIGLADYAQKMRITAKKSIGQDYEVFSQTNLPDLAVDYAVADTVILKEGFRAKAEGRPGTRIVTVGMVDFRIDLTPATSYFKDDETPCSRYQTITFEHLEEIMRKATGKDYMIVDAGSGENLGEYTKEGTNCVPQAIYTSVLHNHIAAKTRKKLLTKNNEQKAGIITGLLGIDLSKLLRVAKAHNGVGQTSIRRFTIINNKEQRNLQIWTLEIPDGKFFVTSTHRPGDINIVVTSGHAYACIPRETPMSGFVEPKDCERKCWLEYFGSRAQIVHEMSMFTDYRDGSVPFYCPKEDRIVASYMGCPVTVGNKLIHFGRHFQWNRLVGRNSRIQALEETYINDTQRYQVHMVEPKETWKLMEESIANFTADFKVDNDYVQKIPIDGGLSHAFAVVWTTRPEADYLRGKLDILAKHGLIVAVSGPLYKDMRMSGKFNAQRFIKDFTRHNDKLGFDFDNKTRKFKAGLSRQFNKSSYPDFLKTAAQFYRENEQQQLAAHFEEASSRYNIGPSEMETLMAEQGRAVLVPDEMKHKRVVQGLQQQIQDLSQDNQELLDQNEDSAAQARMLSSELSLMNKKIKGYESKAIVDPRNLLDLPARLRLNLRKISEAVKDDHEKQYVKSLIDPFHPSSSGVRVPSILPRDTATFNTFLTNELPSDTDVLIIANFELGSQTQAIQMELPAAFYSTLPVASSSEVDGGEENYTVHSISTGYTAQQLSQRLTVFQDSTPSDVYTKLRVVSTGIRFFKTSVSDTESGQLDLHYSRDGSSLDENATMKQVLSRHSSDTQTIYLAGTHGSLRGHTGFVSQCNLRPHDNASYAYRDAEHDKSTALYSDEITPVWFLNETTNKLFVPTSLGSQGNGDKISLVVESLQQRHTFFSRLSNRSANMSITMEMVQHFEGIPEMHKYGFIQRSHALLRSVPTPLELIQKFPTQKIFSNYAMRRDDLMTLLDDNMVRGLWSDTLFPALKDLIAYGADSIQGETLDEWVDAALDTALYTLSTLAPELAPGMVAMRNSISQPAHQAADAARDAIKEWAIGNIHQTRHLQPFEELRKPLEHSNIIDELITRPRKMIHTQSLSQERD